MGQQALAQRDPEGLVNENLKGPASNVLSGGGGSFRGICWMKTWETLLLSSRTPNCPAKSWGWGWGWGWGGKIGRG